MFGDKTHLRFALGCAALLAALLSLPSTAAEIREAEFSKGMYVVAHRTFAIMDHPPANDVLIEVIIKKEEIRVSRSEERAPTPPPAQEAKPEQPVKESPLDVAKAQVKDSAPGEKPEQEYETRKVVVVNFGFDKHEIAPEEAAKIDGVLALLKNAKTVKVTGFTDRVGTKEYNLALSKKRARQVSDYLVSHGVPKGSIEENGLGACCFASDDDKENRRAEVESLSRKSTTQKP